MSATSLRILSRQEVIDAQDFKFEDVPTPEWGEGTGVRIKSLSARERDSYEKSILIKRGSGRKQVQEVDMLNARAKLVVFTAIDETGTLIFTAADVLDLGKKNAAPISRLAEKAMELSGISDDDMEALEGNSADPQPELSVTA